MIQSHGYAALDAQSPLIPFKFERRKIREHDVLIQITHCGVCHSDIHQARNEWGGSIFPMVPGHEIVGKVVQVGAKVNKFKIGDQAGVGCLVDSCRKCVSCHDHLEQYCEEGFVATYNSHEKYSQALTYGGYSNNIVVNQDFVLKIPTNLPLEKVAPLLCAGITTYSPLHHWQINKNHKVGIMGLGGLGHMAIKFARALGAEVVLFTHTAKKKEDGLRLGAHEVVVSTNSMEMNAHLNSFDFILNTISATIDLSNYTRLLKREGTLVMVGVASKPPALPTTDLIFQRRQIAGSLIGGLKETQEMLDFCGQHQITAEVELIPIQKINEAFEKTIRGEVKYRFVIDMSSLTP